jgi:indolepyruvate ferredoxin oxidoreductase
MNYQILNGNELLIQGGLEAGFSLYTGYPGSPLADFFNILFRDKDELHKKGIKVILSNNEAHAAAMASGAKMAGQNVLLGMKSMGLHVASDALSVGNFANPGEINEDGSTSGVVIAVGDDPWSLSTSTPADSRYLFKHLHIPFLEPSTPQELKDWMAKALELSQKTSVYTGLLLTTNMAEGGGRVSTSEHKYLDSEAIDLDPAKFNLRKHVMVPPNSLHADVSMINERAPRIAEVLASLNLDQSQVNSTQIGFISSGATYEVLKQVLEETKLIEAVSLYKSASSYPLNVSSLLPFIKEHKNIIVVEEKRGFFEAEIRALVQRENVDVNIMGKFLDSKDTINGFPAFGGLNYEIIFEKINHILDMLEFNKPDHTCVLSNAPSANFILQLDLPNRLPTFCPGCPHRETLSLLKDLRKTLKNKDINLISHGDVGCYSLSFLEPFKEMHDLSAMGQGGAMGAGTDIFTTNPSVVLMGDSTFFHSGMTGISNSVQLGHNITYILLDNDNTAMTGHQMTPVSGLNVSGENSPRQDVLGIIKAMKVHDVIEVNPSDRYFYKSLLEDYVTKPGVKVIISKKECGLTYHGREKSINRKLHASGEVTPIKKFYQINTFTCEDCRECVDNTGCPGLSQSFDAYGTKVQIDPQICVSDGYCTKIKVCPSFELVEVIDYHPTKYQSAQDDTEKVVIPLPEIKKDLIHIAGGDDFKMVVIGVGGTGVTTISKVLAQACESMDGRDDLDFKFFDQKGLAQRNGSVTSHLSIFKKGRSGSQVTATGRADLVLSPDLLEGARAIKYLKQDATLLVDETYQVPLGILLDDGINKDPLTAIELIEELKNKLKSNVVIAPLKELSFKTFQKAVYSNAMLLGSAFQAALLPFKYESMIQAITDSVPKADISNNLRAFEMGREWYYKRNNNNAEAKEQELSIFDFEKSVVESLYPWQSKTRHISRFRNEVKRFSEQFPTIPKLHHGQYIHDLMVFDQGRKLEDLYLNSIELQKEFDGKELTTAIAVLVKTYWIKDEVYVSHLLSSHLKRQVDANQYQNIGIATRITHINRPHFELFGRELEFDLNAKDWMLKVMKHFRILRILLPSWHSKEKEISISIQRELLSLKKDSYKRIKELASIKGYREIRYQRAKEVLR